MFGSGILVGEKTIDLASDAVLFRDVGRLQVRGRHQAVRVAEPLALIERATDAQRRLAADAAEALAAYEARRFEEARDRLAPLVAVDDGPAKLLAERVDRLLEDPPPPDWDGALMMRS